MRLLEDLKLHVTHIIFLLDSAPLKDKKRRNESLENITVILCFSS